MPEEWRQNISLHDFFDPVGTSSDTVTEKNRDRRFRGKRFIFFSRKTDRLRLYSSRARRRTPNTSTYRVTYILYVRATAESIAGAYNNNNNNNTRKSQ